jgi:hypothetical protein
MEQAALHAPETSRRTTDDRHLVAYNAAFRELNLRFEWSADIYDALHAGDDERACITRYIETWHPHLLKAYDIAFLSQLIYAKKTEHYLALVQHQPVRRVAN